MDIYPTRIERLPGKQLLIEWSDGERRSYAYRELQDNCPCATCREKRKQPAQTGSAANTGPLLPLISAEEAQPLEIRQMVPVGNYAYHIFFNHGCDSGIYSFEFLRELGQIVA